MRAVLYHVLWGLDAGLYHVLWGLGAGLYHAIWGLGAGLYHVLWGLGAGRSIPRTVGAWCRPFYNVLRISQECTKSGDFTTTLVNSFPSPCDKTN